MKRYRVTEKAPIGDISRDFDTATDAYNFYKNSDVSEQNITVWDLQEKEKIDIDGLRGRVAVEETAKSLK